MQKQLSASQPEKGFGNRLLEGAERRVFLLDTCYLRRLISSGHGIYESLKRLSAHGDIIITSQVLGELERQVKFERPRAEAAGILGELHRAFNEGIAMMERVEVPEEEVERLSGLMASASEKGNSRVGKGEASIFKIAKIIRGLYGSMHVLTQDSDVNVLKRALGFGEMQVAAEYGA